VKYYFSIVMFSVFLLPHSTIHADEKREARHYVEANISANYIFTSGDRLEDQRSFASGFHIAHGTNITPQHALVLSFGKDFLTNNRGTLTSKAFYLRRYLPQFSTPNLSLYATLGSGSYTYEDDDSSGVLENAGIIVGAGLDYHLSEKIRLSLEADYRGFTVKQFGGNAEDSIQPFTLFAGFKYYYSATPY